MPDMVIMNTERGKFAAQDRRSQAEHEEEIERIKSGELGVDWVEGSDMGAAGFTVTDDGLWIGPADRVYRIVRGERNLGLADESADQIVVLDGSRVEGWLVSLTANELDEQNAAHTRQELQARQFEAWEAATTRAISKARKAVVAPTGRGSLGNILGDRKAGSVEKVNEIGAEYGLEIRKATGGGWLVYAGSPKADVEQMGDPGVRRISQIPDAVQDVYAHLGVLGRAYRGACSMPKCGGDGECLVDGLVLCADHLG